MVLLSGVVYSMTIVGKLSEGLRLMVAVVHDRDGAALVRRFNNVMGPT